MWKFIKFSGSVTYKKLISIVLIIQVSILQKICIFRTHSLKALRCSVSHYDFVIISQSYSFNSTLSRQNFYSSFLRNTLKCNTTLKMQVIPFSLLVAKSAQSTQALFKNVIFRLPYQVCFCPQSHALVFCSNVWCVVQRPTFFPGYMELSTFKMASVVRPQAKMIQLVFPSFTPSLIKMHPLDLKNKQKRRLLNQKEKGCKVLKSTMATIPKIDI